MKKALFFSLSIMIFSLLLSPGMAWCAAKAVVDKPVYDAGDVPQGKEISNEFILKNAGNEPLTFKVRPC